MQKTLAVLGLTTLLMMACSSEGETAGSGSGGSPSSGGSTGSGGGSSTTVPSDTSADGMAAFVTAASYSEAPWVAETSGPRESASTVSPHGRVRVWFNDVIVASQEAGNGEDISAPTHTADSMAVKELYDDGTTVVGHAIMLKTDAADDDWLYYCVGPADRCASGEAERTADDPLIGTPTSCTGCHAGTVYTKAP